MATFTFYGEDDTSKASSNPWISMLMEHAPDVLGCCAKESFDGWPTITFDLVKIHEGINRNYQIILDYEITGNDFSKSHIVQIVMDWDARKQGFVGKHFAMQQYLQPIGWCQGDFPEESGDIHPFDPKNRGWDGPELRIGPQYVKSRLFIEFPQEVFKKLRLVRGIQHLGPEPKNVNSVDMRVLTDLYFRMLEEEKEKKEYERLEAVAVVEPVAGQLGEDHIPF